MRSWGLRYFLVGTLVSLSFAACRGASVEDLFEGPGLDEASHGPPNGKGPGKDPDASSGDGDAGAAPGSDGAPDAGDGGVSGTILCGDIEKNPTYCDQETQFCCVTTIVTSTLRTCVSRNPLSLCTGPRVGCDSAGDCESGEVCCGVFNEHVGYTSIECTPRARCEEIPPPDDSYVFFCDPDSEEDECASTDEECRPSKTLEGYYVCGK